MARVLAAASAGGHLEQLMLLRGVLEQHEVRYATTDSEMANAHGIADPLLLPDCNFDQPLRAIWCMTRALRLIRRVKPEVVVSTGAAPGLICIFWGRLWGARTLWIDSLANAGELSLSGRLAKKLADECWTQWEHLADPTGPRYHGSLL